MSTVTVRFMMPFLSTRDQISTDSDSTKTDCTWRNALVPSARDRAGWRLGFLFNAEGEAFDRAGSPIDVSIEPVLAMEN